MKFKVIFQDWITFRVVEAKNENEAAAKAQKLVKDLLVVSCKKLEEDHK